MPKIIPVLKQTIQMVDIKSKVQKNKILLNSTQEDDYLTTEKCMEKHRVQMEIST